MHLYDERLQKDRTISRFKDTAYCGTLRGDGKLVAAGGESGIVQVFDANSRSLLRQLKGHTRPVHSVTFGSDKTHILSAGDDAAVRWWDVASGTQVGRLDGHTDYVRAAALSPHSEELIATGGYDHTCKLWDVRSQKLVASMDHGLPIESLAFFQAESLLLTAGGQKVCCWDLTGRRLLHQFNAHQKTISTIQVSSADGNVRVLTGSLDGHVKVFDPATFKMVYACKYPAPVLSMALAPDANTLAVGLADGTLSFRKRKLVKPTKDKARYMPRMTAGNFRYFIRNQSAPSDQDDLIVAQRKKAALAEHDKFLRKFRYADALDRSLQGGRPGVVFAVVEELMARGGLSIALRNRDEETLLPLIDFLAKYIRDPRYSKDAINVCHRILDTYEFPMGSGSEDMDGTTQAIVVSLGLLREQIGSEVRLHEEILGIKGMLDTLLTASM